MRWYSIGQLQEGFEPDHLTVPKNLHVSPAFRSAYDGADRYRNDVDQVMVFRPILPWVADLTEVFFYRFQWLLGHGYSFSIASFTLFHNQFRCDCPVSSVPSTISLAWELCPYFLKSDSHTRSVGSSSITESQINIHRILAITRFSIFTFWQTIHLCF